MQAGNANTWQLYACTLESLEHISLHLSWLCNTPTAACCIMYKLKCCKYRTVASRTHVNPPPTPAQPHGILRNVLNMEWKKQDSNTAPCAPVAVYVFYLSVCLSVCLSVYQSLHLSSSSRCLCVCLSLSLSPPLYLHLILSLFLSVYLAKREQYMYVAWTCS